MDGSVVHQNVEGGLDSAKQVNWACEFRKTL